MRKLTTKLIALVMAVAVVVSLVSVASVSVSAADANIELVGEKKSVGDMYGLSKEGESKNKFKVVNVSELKAGEVEYNGPSTTAYFAEINCSQDKDGMGIDFNQNIDVTSVTDGKEDRFMLDMWIWIENVKKVDALFLRMYEKTTYKDFVTLGKVEVRGEYRLVNQGLQLGSLVDGWNHIKIKLPTFGLSDNDYEKEAFKNFRNGEYAKSICAMSLMNRSKDGGKTEKGVGDYAIASVRITTLKQIKADYPNEYEGEEEEEGNSIDDEEENEEPTLLNKIANKQIDQFMTALEKDGIINVSKYDAACQEKVRAAAKERGIEIKDLGDGKWTAAGGKNDPEGESSSSSSLLIIIIIGAVVAAAVVAVIVLLVLKKKKTVPAVEEVKTEEIDEE